MTPSPIERTATILAALIALMVAAPVISIVVMAIARADDLWPHLIAYVLPQALRETTLLLIGVGIVALIAGAGTAWLVSLYDFAGRRTMLWLLPLPLAIPTYLAAYVYVDLFEPLGLFHTMLMRWLSAQESVVLLPQMRSLPGAIVVIGLVLYPYVYLSTRAMFQLQSAEFVEAAHMLGASKWTVFRRVSLPMSFAFGNNPAS